MASELSMNGRKKIETLQKEFTQKFPYLTLVFLDKERRAIDISKSLSEVRQAKGDDISIIASLKVNTLEKRFLENFGLVVEVAYQKADKVVYTKENIDKTLNELNKWCGDNGCQPFEFKKSFTGNTLSSVQEQLFEVIKEYYPNAEAKKINKDNYLDIYMPEINKKRGAHLFFNTAKDGIKIGFYCRDEEFVENVLSKSSNIEKYAQGIRILNNPLQNDVEVATRSALNFIKEIIGEQKNNSGDKLISKLIGDFTETFDLNDYLGYNLIERPGKMSVYEISSSQMELAIESKELDFEFEFIGSVDLNDWNALSNIIGKEESLENKKEYSEEHINQSGNINFLYCEGTYVYSVLNPGDSDDDESKSDSEEDDLDKILRDLGYTGDDDDDEDEEEEDDDEDEDNDESWDEETEILIRFDLEEDEVNNVIKKIKKDKVLPHLPYINEALTKKGFEMDNHICHFFISYLYIGDQRLEGFLYVNMDGFYSDCINEELKYIFTWDSIKKIEIIEQDGKGVTINLVSAEGKLTISDPYSKNLLLLVEIYNSVWINIIKKFADEEIISWNEVEKMGIKLLSFETHEEYLDWINS